MKKKLIIFFTLLISFFVILLLWWNQAVKPPNPNDKKTTIFTINSGETVRDISERLQKQNFIRSSVAFFLFTRFTGIANTIQAGEFRLSPSMDLIALAKNLTHGTIDVRITIPEGWRNEEIALKLTQELNMPEKEFLKYAHEGYMFPDTYHLTKEATPAAIAKIFMDNFHKKVTQTEIGKAEEKGLSTEELVTIASLVEREVKFDQDRPLVASVILNRLKIGMKLDIDATVQYAIGYQPKEKTWWKKNLTNDDLVVNSPYNTYKNPGLPPTPICNPGLAAIKAILEAPETHYLYYISDINGKIHFAETIEEHNANINKYLNR